MSITCEKCIHYSVCEARNDNHNKIECDFYAEERPHGKWKKEPLTENTAWYVCSVCGDKVCCYGNNFCPNCGADMRKEGE